MSLRRSKSWVPDSPHSEEFHTEPPGGGDVSVLVIVTELCSQGCFSSRKYLDRSQNVELSRPPELRARGKYSVVSGLFSPHCIDPLFPVTEVPSRLLAVWWWWLVVPGAGDDVPGAFPSVHHNMEDRDKGRDRSSRW